MLVKSSAYVFEKKCWACLQARNILVAVGGRPTVPPIEGAEHTIISDQARLAFC